MSRIRSVALACALAAATLPGFAASSASASISNIQFQLIDLTPTDASVSSFSLANVPLLFASYLSDASQTKNEVSYDFDGLFTHAKVVSGDLGTVSASSSMWLSGLSVQGEATGPGTSFGAFLQNAYGYDSVIKLSAQSMLIITADSVVKASASNPSPCGCDSEFASAGTSMSLQYDLQTPAGTIYGSSNNNLSTFAFARKEYSFQSFDGDGYSTVVWPTIEGARIESRQFYAVFVNNTDIEQAARFSIAAQAGGRATSALGSNPIPVPEPATWALTVAGLGLMGFVARRRAC